MAFECRLVPGIDNNVSALKISEIKPRKSSGNFLLSNTHFANYFKTLLAFSLITALCTPVAPVIGYRAVGFIFLLGVFAVGTLSSLGSVLFAALLSVLFWNFFFIPPRFNFTIAHPDDLLLCLTYFVAAITTGLLTNQNREKQAIIREREGRLRQAELLQESEKLHQTILNSISHEIRTPLTAIMGSASALGDDSLPDSPEFRRALVKELASASDRLNRVIENLLDMSRLSSGMLVLKKEWHEVNDLIGVTLRGLGSHLQRHSIEVVIGPKMPLVEIDFRLFEHVLTNIILNAVQYSPPDQEIKISANAQGSWATIIIADRGPGIAEEFIPRVFEKFFRLPGTPTGGTGLGLSISKSIVELHGGDITARNRRTGGIKFTISLPLGTPPKAPEE
jgi:two-component system sensor histidine kinase KdpD